MSDDAVMLAYDRGSKVKEVTGMRKCWKYVLTAFVDMPIALFESEIMSERAHCKHNIKRVTEFHNSFCC